MGASARSTCVPRVGLLLLGAALVAASWAPVRAAAEALADVDAPPSEHALLESDALFADDFDRELEDEPHDPLEGVNRKIFRGNRFLDRWLFEPLTHGYRFVLPAPVRRSVRGVFENLGSPGVIVNNVLQGEGAKARETSARFLVNTTVGLAGIWDPATRIGYHAHPADFGQTLGRAGVESGPYLVLPVFGPNTTRDLVGGVVDIAMRPDTWLLPFSSLLVLGSTDGISIRDVHLEEINALEASSVDFYAAMRSAFLMNREALVRGDAREETVPAASSAPSPLAEPLSLP